MASQRKYPNKTCINPDCQIEFTPSDKRSKYCKRQCQVNYNNDKKSKALAEGRYLQKLERSDLILDYLYTHAGGAQYSIKESILRLQQVDLSLGTLAKDRHSGEEIRWYIHFGLIRTGSGENDYFIVSREELGL